MAEKKYLGRDCELSTTGLDAEGCALDSWTVTRVVLQQIKAAARSAHATVWSQATDHVNPSASYYGSAHAADCLRHWSSAGSCFYADMAHLECCTAASLHPRTFAAQSIAALLVAEKARQLAQMAARTGHRYELSASNADLLDPSISFGSHISVSVSQALWENLFIDQRHPAVLGFVASAIAAAIPFFGSGYLLPLKNGLAIFSLSARAHHISKLHTLATTEKWRRGLLNSRREAHGSPQERLHLIGFDYSIVASVFLASFLQCALAAAEHGYCRLNLVDPVRAMHVWSWNLDVRTGKTPATAMLVDGRELTLPQYVREVVQELLAMCEGRLIEDTVAPEAEMILPRIIECTHYAEEGSLMRCATHLDWAAKLMFLRNMGGRFEDAAMRIADHDFANTNQEKGTIWRLWQQALIDPLIDMDDALDSMRNAPPESRDWGRGRIIERFAQDILAVDWSYVELRRASGWFSPRLRVDFPQLDSWNQSTFEPIIRSVRDIEELKRALREQETLSPIHDDGHTFEAVDDDFAVGRPSHLEN